MAFLHRLLEINQHKNINSTILRGNLIGPKIEITGLLMQNWGDRELIIKQNDLLVTIILSEYRESILMGNPREKSHIDGNF